MNIFIFHNLCILVIIYVVQVLPLGYSVYRQWYTQTWQINKIPKLNLINYCYESTRH